MYIIYMEKFLYVNRELLFLYINCIFFFVWDVKDLWRILDVSFCYDIWSIFLKFILVLYSYLKIESKEIEWNILFYVDKFLNF